MRRLVYRLFDFIETRFPLKVTVTLEKYTALELSLSAQEKKIEELQGRVGQLEAGIRAISMQMGFAGKMPGDFNLER